MWKNGFYLKFKGITPQIVLSIHHNANFEVWISDEKGNLWDILTDFDVYAKRDGAGLYYCSLCLEKHREFYSSERELWEKHSLEPMLAWANENLRPDRWACLCKTGGVRWAELIEADKLPECRQGDSFYATFPVGVR